MHGWMCIRGLDTKNDFFKGASTINLRVVPKFPLEVGQLIVSVCIALESEEAPNSRLQAKTGGVN